MVECCCQVRQVEVERWLNAVQEMLSQDATGSGDTERIQDELNKCKVRNVFCSKYICDVT